MISGQPFINPASCAHRRNVGALFFETVVRSRASSQSEKCGEHARQNKAPQSWDPFARWDPETNRPSTIRRRVKHG